MINGYRYLGITTSKDGNNKDFDTYTWQCSKCFDYYLKVDCDLYSVNSYKDAELIAKGMVPENHQCS